MGKEVGVKIIRNKIEQEFNVTLGRLEDSEKQVSANDTTKTPDKNVAPPAAPILGMSLAELTDELRVKFKTDAKLKGVLVTEVADGSAASDKAVMAGDVVQEAGGKKVTTAADVSASVDQAVKDGKNSILMLVARGSNPQETRFLALKLKP